jgi:hypothetical protein
MGKDGKMIIYEIALSKEEQTIAKEISAERSRLLLERGQVPKDMTGDTGEVRDETAFGAELAVAKALNVYPIFENVAKPPKFDLIKFHRVIEVKSTRHPLGNLLVPNLDLSLTYILVRTHAYPVCHIMGWIEGGKIRLFGKLYRMSIA